MISLLTLACHVVGIPLHAFVLRQLWGWYFTPELGISPPSMLFFFGAGLLASMFKTHNIQREKDSEEVALTKAFTQVLGPLVYLSIGWLGFALFGA